MQLSRPSALWCLNWSIITNVPWLMASFANLHLSNIQRVRIEKNRILIWIPYIDYFALLSQSIWKWKKVFAHLPFIFFRHSDIHKAQPSYVCVFTFITLFALQLPAGHISLVGSEKEGVIKKQYISWSPFTDLLQFKIEKRTTNKQTKNKTKQNKQKRKEQQQT